MTDDKKAAGCMAASRQTHDEHHDENPKGGDVESWSIQLSPAAEDAQFKKTMGWLDILAAGFNVSNSWLVIAATMTISLSSGPMDSIWGVIVVTPVFLCIALTLCELVSAYPTTGGQYHWTYILAPDSIKAPASYFCGFINWLSWVGMSASSSGAVIYAVYALIMNSEPNFVPQTWHSFLIFECVVLISLVTNVFGKVLLPKYYSSGFILSVSAFVVFTVVVLAMQKDLQASNVVWTSYVENSGWPEGFQFLIALSAPTVAFCPIDGAVHLIEEVKDASRVVPRTIMAALVISFITSFAFILATLYSISDYDAILSAPSGFPLFTAWQQATGKTDVAVVFTAVTIYLLPVGTIACTQVAGMLAWSMAQDKGLAFSNIFTRVDKHLKAPVCALILNWSIMFAIGILFFASSVAYNSIVGITVIFQEITLAVPPAFLLYHRRSDLVLPKNRTFKLSPIVGWIANAVTVLFAVITIPIFMFPVTRHPNASTMNYDIAVFGGIVAVMIINWFAYARGRFTGPTVISFGQ